MTRRPMRWRDALGFTLALSAVAAPVAAETFSVTALRTEKVTLYDCNPDKDKRKAQAEVDRKSFVPAWPATRDPVSPLYLKVHANGGEYCVRAFAVQTDRPVRIEKDAECGAMVAGKQPKTGAIRGVGEKCP